MESPRLHRRFLLPALAFGSAVAVFAAMTCFGPPTRSLADPDPGQSTTAFAIPFPAALQGEIARLEKDALTDTSKEQRPAKKAWILKTALADLSPQPFTSNASLYGLKNLGDYRFDLSKTRRPSFLPEIFR